MAKYRTLLHFPSDGRELDLYIVHMDKYLPPRIEPFTSSCDLLTTPPISLTADGLHIDGLQFHIILGTASYRRLSYPILG